MLCYIIIKMLSLLILQYLVHCLCINIWKLFQAETWLYIVY